MAIGPWVRSPRPARVLLRLPCHSPHCPWRRQGPSRCEAAIPLPWAPACAGGQLSQPLQRSTQPFGFRGLGLMVGTGFLHCFGLGALGEVRVGEPLRRGCRAPFRPRPRLSTGGPLGFEVDDALERQARRSASSTTTCAAPLPSNGRQLDGFQPRQPRTASRDCGRAESPVSSDASAANRLQLGRRRDVQFGPRDRTSLISSTSQSISRLRVRIDLRLAAPAIARRSARRAARFAFHSSSVMKGMSG